MLTSKPQYHDRIAGITDWRKSTRSGPYTDNCVEMAPIDDTGAVAVRDSTAPTGPVLVFTAGEIRAWVEGAKAGDFDHLL